MAEERSTPRRIEWGRFIPSPEEGERIWRWVFFSGFLHVAIIISLFLMPHIPIRTAPSYPVYTVDLVGGERIGGTSRGSVVARGTEPKKETQKLKAESPPQPQKEVKKKSVEKAALMEEKVALKKSKKEAPAEKGTYDQVREKLIQAAVERLKNRTESEQKKQKAEGISSGPGEGEGAAAKGEGGQGGGIVKEKEFVLYFDLMLSRIRDSWVWMGKRSDLEVVVRFGIQENGEIAGLKIVKRSGDASYDESVIRAVRQASPLASPPEKYREVFKDVELKFLPKDLGG